jgi:CHAD domain-containing protein
MLTPPLGLGRSEALDAGFRRVLFEQFRVVALALDSQPEAIGRAVHIARRTLKKIRALLRLVASGEGGRVMAAPLTSLRDAGRSLAAVRHADVIVTVVRAAIADLPESHDPGPLANLEPLLEAERESVLAAQGAAALSIAARQTGAARRVVEAWKPSATDFDLIRAGIGDWYGRGRDAKGAACGSANTEAFHTWRKRAKDVRYQVQFLSPIAPEMVAVADDLHRLTNLLGDANDLDHLEAAARSHWPAAFDEADGAFQFLADRRGSFWSAACSIGHEFFAEDSTAYAARLESYWDVWVTEGPQSADVGQG